MNLPRRPVAIVGAGPVGLTTALVLARAGVPVTVLEAAEELSTASKASTFHPSTLDLLDELGVAGPLRQAGREVHEIQWRDLDQRITHSLPYAALKGLTAHPYRLHVEQSRLTPLLLDALAKYPHAEVYFGHSVLDVRLLADGVRLWVGAPHRTRALLDAGYVVAADGSRSTVRSLLHLPSQAQEYSTYALRVITDPGVGDLLPDLSPLAYIRDPRQSFSMLGMPDHWRLIYRISGQVPRDQVLAPGSVRDLIARSLPAIAGQVTVLDAHTYRLAAFVLPDYRAGRVVFAGDAAHLTSTAGGMNMNCGLHDAIAWGRALARVHHGRAQESELTEVATERRSVLVNGILPRTEARTAGLDDPEALRRALAEIGMVAADPAGTTDYLVKASLLDSAPQPQIAV
jgi:2-polyprenyl-6-methoxyphenol hydroxylase-like FAD-dependent oxidoreductase